MHVCVCVAGTAAFAPLVGSGPLLDSVRVEVRQTPPPPVNPSSWLYNKALPPPPPALQVSIARLSALAGKEAGQSAKDARASTTATQDVLRALGWAEGHVRIAPPNTPTTASGRPASRRKEGGSEVDSEEEEGEEEEGEEEVKEGEEDGGTRGRTTKTRGYCPPSLDPDMAVKFHLPGASRRAEPQPEALPHPAAAAEPAVRILHASTLPNPAP